MTSAPPIETDVLDPTTQPGWNETVGAHPQSSFFHCAEWASVLRDAYGYRPRYLVALRDNALAGLIPFMHIDSRLTGRRGVALPFTDSADPFADAADVMQRLIEDATRHGRTAGWRSWEIRGLPPAPKEGRSASATFRRHFVPLDADEETLFRRLDSSTRRNVRKATKSGVRAQVFQDQNALMSFYRLNCLTRRDHGLPPQPRAFFAHLHRHVFAAGMGTVVLAEYEDRRVAGAVFFRWNRRVYYKYGASDRRHWPLRANDLVMWEALRWHAAEGAAEMDLGRTELENEGLRRFKLGWGARETDVTYCKYDVGSRNYVTDAPRIYGRHNAVFRRTPMPLLKGIGWILYRHVG